MDADAEQRKADLRGVGDVVGLFKLEDDRA
jgi:hypothetical protein